MESERTWSLGDWMGWIRDERNGVLKFVTKNIAEH